MQAWAVVKAGEPLQLIEMPTPEPTGSEVLVRVTHCGVCHSDLHFWHGGYDMGGGTMMKLEERGVVLPSAPGHEVVGEVVAFGPDASGVEIGQMRVVYPWIGCGTCSACLAEQDNLCTAQKSIGVVRQGGFASHVLVPNPRYLVDFGTLDPALAATYACSGITTYSAIGKLMPLTADEPIVLIGAGGLGLAAIEVLKAMGHAAIVSVDLNADKRRLAEQAGATTVDGGDGDVTAAIRAAAGGPVRGVIDFVGRPETAELGIAVLAKGGKFVSVGMAGGQLKLSLPILVFRAISILGSNTGSLGDLRAVIAMAQDGRLKPSLVHTCPKHEVNRVMTDLEQGRVEGRVVLAG